MQKPLDILVIAPTREEFNVCLYVLFSKKSAKGTLNTAPTLNIGSDVPPSGALFKVDLIMDKMVGLFCLDGTGNLNAAISSYSILDVYRPQMVLLAGIAAGKTPASMISPDGKNEILVGDVVFNRSIIYSAYGKTAGQPHKFSEDNGKLKADIYLTETEKEKVRQAWALGLRVDYRESQRELDPSGLAPMKLIKELATSKPAGGPALWELIAKSAFDQLSNGAGDAVSMLAEWHGLPHSWSPDEAGRRRKWSMVHEADMASGEMVVASDAYQALFRHAVYVKRGENVIARAYEMEAFALARICKEKMIPFLTIRGISDPGDERKDGTGGLASGQRVKDGHHLAAACLAAAFTRQAIASDSLQAWLRGRNRRPSGEIQGKVLPVKCLDSGVGTGCPTNPSHACLAHAAQFSGLDGEIPGGIRINLSRVYENLQPDEYSSFLSNLFETNGGRNKFRYHALLLYPYSAGETVKICRDMGIPITGKTLEEEANSLASQEVLVRDKFAHFSKIEAYARMARKQGVWVDRIIIGEDDKLKPAEQLILRIVLCGGRKKIPAVRTYYRSKKTSRAGEFVPDDIVLVKEASVSEAASKDGASDYFNKRPIAFRYFDRSEMLVVRGWRCPAAGGFDSAGNEDALTKLLRRWNNECKSGYSIGWTRFAVPLFVN